MNTTIELTPYLPPELLAEALNAARGIEDGGWRAKALVELAPYLPPALLDGALTAARAIVDEHHRVKFLTRLSTHLSSGPSEQVLTEALITASAIEFEWTRVKTLRELSTHLAARIQQQPVLAYKAACTTLRTLATNPRPEFLNDLKALLPFLMALVPEDDREQVAADIFHAIQDVTEWWP